MIVDGEMIITMVATATTVGLMTMMNRGVRAEIEDGVMTVTMTKICSKITFHPLGKVADMENIQDWYDM